MIMIPVTISIGLQQIPSTSLDVLHVNFVFSKLQIQQSTYKVSYHRKIHEVSLCEFFYVHSTSKNAFLDATVRLVKYRKPVMQYRAQAFVCVSKKTIFFPFMGFAFYSFWSQQNQQNCSK